MYRTVRGPDLAAAGGMKIAAPLLLLFLCGCQPDPGAGELTGTSSPEAEARRATEAPPAATDTAVTGTFGGPSPGLTPTAPNTFPGATAASTLTDPNVSTPAPPAATTT